MCTPFAFLQVCGHHDLCNHICAFDAKSYIFLSRYRCRHTGFCASKAVIAFGAKRSAITRIDVAVADGDPAKPALGREGAAQHRLLGLAAGGFLFPLLRPVCTSGQCSNPLHADHRCQRSCGLPSWPLAPERRLSWPASVHLPAGGLLESDLSLGRFLAARRRVTLGLRLS